MVKENVVVKGSVKNIEVIDHENISERNVVNFNTKVRGRVDNCLTDIYRGKSPMNISMYDLMGVPEKYLINDEVFSEWFAAEFFSLDKDGIKRFGELLQKAYESFWGAFNGESGRFKFSDKVRDKMDEGFSSISDVRSFLAPVKISDEEDWQSFLQLDLSNKRKNNPSREKLSTCKLLKRATTLNWVESSYKNSLQGMKRVLGITDYFEENKFKDHPEFLSSILPRPKEFFDNIMSRDGSLDELVKNKALVFPINFTGDNVLFIDNRPIRKVRQFILSIKSQSSFQAKIEQKAENVNDDFFRTRLVLDDWDSSKEAFSRILFEELEKIMDGVNNSPKKMAIEVRVKGGYLNKDQVCYLEKKYGDNLNISIKGHHNPQSSSDYKAINTKISYLDGNGEKSYSFEMQILGEKQNLRNENPESKSAHFIKDLLRLIEHVPRFEGAMTKDDFKILFNNFLKHYREQARDRAKEIVYSYKSLNLKTNKLEFKSRVRGDISKMVNDLQGKLGSYEENENIFLPKVISGAYNFEGKTPKHISKKVKPRDKKEKKVPVYDKDGNFLYKAVREEFEIRLGNDYLEDKLFDYLVYTGKIKQLSGNKRNVWDNVQNVLNKKLFTSKVILKKRKKFLENIDKSLYADNDFIKFLYKIKNEHGISLFDLKSLKSTLKGISHEGIDYSEITNLESIVRNDNNLKRDLLELAKKHEIDLSENFKKIIGLDFA